MSVRIVTPLALRLLSILQVHRIALLWLACLSFGVLPQAQGTRMSRSSSEDSREAQFEASARARIETSGQALVNYPLNLRVTQAPPGSTGFLMLSLAAPRVGHPDLQAVPGSPFLTESFVVDAAGNSGFLFGQVLPPESLGEVLIAQAVIVAPAAAGKVVFSEPMRIPVETKRSTQPPEDAPIPSSPRLADHATLTRADAMEIRGMVAGATSVEVEGPFGLTVVAVSGGAPNQRRKAEGGRPDAQDPGVGTFRVLVPLAQNQLNAVSFTGISELGVRSAPALARIVRDENPPTLFVDLPASDTTGSSAEVSVAGRVSDTLSGLVGLTVTVDGVPAQVDPGTGTHGTFFRARVPLHPGEAKSLTVVATDILGNQITRIVTVAQASATGERLSIGGGDAQTGFVRTRLPQPIVAHVERPEGGALASKAVRFVVTRSDGYLSDGEKTGQDLTVRTDRNGDAVVFWTLGSDAGQGNDRVQVTSTDIHETLTLCASAAAAPVARLVVGSGDGQQGEVGAPLAEPLRLFSSDGQNPAPNVAVTFAIVSGGGRIDGESEVVRTTDATGHAQVDWTLGPKAGVQFVEATFSGQSGAPVRFTAEALTRQACLVTSSSGVVLDPSRRPIGGATCRLSVAGSVLETTTDVEGCFRFENALSGGSARLEVDGRTATWLGGLPIPEASFAPLVLDLTLVPEARNPLSEPLRLPRLTAGAVDESGAKEYSLTQPTVLGVPGLEGLEFTIAPGSMRIDGFSAEEGELVTLTPVQYDELPMPLSDGAAPHLAWILEPDGARFDPPITIRMPNVAGLRPGAIGKFLVFDPATRRLEIAATGAVSADGLFVVTDPGTGLALAGWGGFAPSFPCRSLWSMRDEVAVVGAARADREPLHEAPRIPAVAAPEDRYFTCFLKLLSSLRSSVLDEPGQDCVQFVDPASAYLDPVLGRAHYLDCVDAYRQCIDLILADAKRKPSTVVGSPEAGVAERAGVLGDHMLERVIAARNGQPIDEAGASVTVLEASRLRVVEDLPADIFELTLQVDYVLSPSVPLAVGDGNVLGGLSAFGFPAPSFAAVFVESTFAGGAIVRVAVFELEALPRVTATIGGRSLPVTNFSEVELSNVPDAPGTPARPVVVHEGVGVVHVSAPQTFQAGLDEAVTELGAVPLFPRPTFPESISLFLSQETVTDPGASVLATVTGVMDDGSVRDLSYFGDGTTYRSSRPELASVDQAGRITVHGQQSGAVLITATNQGTTATSVLQLSMGGSVTTVKGVVRFGNLTVAPNAVVRVSALGTPTTTDGVGFYMFENVPALLDTISVRARLDVGSDSYYAAATNVVPMPGGDTIVDLTLESAVFWDLDGSGDWSFATNWSNDLGPGVNDIAIIEVDADATITVDGTFSVASVVCDENLLLGSGSQLNVSELLDVTGGITVSSGGTLSASEQLLQAGASLNGGTISGGRCAAGEPLGGWTVTSGAGTLSSGVQMDADMVVNSSAYVTVSGGLTLNGTATLNGSSALYFTGSQSLLGDGEVVFVGSNNYVYQYSGGTLTIGPEMTVRGQSGYVYSYSAGLVNQGTIRAETSGQTITVGGTNWSNESSGTIEAVGGGNLSLEGTFTNNGTISASGGVQTLGSGGAWTNAGTITASGSTLTMGGDWTNSGTINAQTSVVNLGGTFTQTAIGGMTVTGGPVNLTGTLQNAGQMFDVTQFATPLRLAGGTIDGGTVTDGGGAGLVVTNAGSTLSSNVQMDASLVLNASTYVFVTGGLTLNGTATLNDSSALYFSGTQSLLGDGEVVFSGSNNYVYQYSSGTLTIGPEMTIRGQGGYVYAYSAGLVNQGTIRVDVSGQALTVVGTNWSNETQGTLEAMNGGTLRLQGSYSNSGTISVSGSTLSLEGTFETSALGIISADVSSTINLVGTMQNAGQIFDVTQFATPLRLAGGTIDGGTVTGGGGAGLVVTNAGSTLSSNVQLDANLQLNAGLYLYVLGGLTLNGTATLDASSGIYFAGAQSLLGNGSVVLSSGNYLYPSPGPLTIGPDMTIRGQSGTVGHPSYELVNQGTIRPDAGQTLTVVGTNWSNAPQGTLEAMNGSALRLQGSYSNSGTISTNGSTLSLEGTFSTAGLGTINADALSTINLVGTMQNAGQIFDVAQFATPLRLAGGTIEGGTVTDSGGAGLVVTNAGSILSSNVQLDANLELNAGLYLYVLEGLTLNGTATLGASSGIYFAGAQSLLGNGSVVLSSGNYLYPSPGPLTIGPDMTIRGQSGTVGHPSYGLVNQGTIRPDAGQTLTVVGTNWSNAPQGTLEAMNGSALRLQGSYSNSGTISTNGSTLSLEGTFSTAGLGTIAADVSSTINLVGTMQNAGQIFDVAQFATPLRLAGGTIEGGTVTDSGGAGLVVTNAGSILSSNVQLDANLELNAGLYLYVLEGLTLNGTATLGASSGIYFAGAQSLLGNGSVVLSSGNYLYPYPGPLTIGPDMTIRGQSGTLGHPSYELVNQGTIRPDAGQTITVTGTNWSNAPQGTLEAMNGAALRLQGSYSNSGTISVSDSTLSLEGIFSTEGLGTISADASSTINLAGTMQNAGQIFDVTQFATPLRLAGGTIEGGTVTDSGGAGLVVTSSGSTLSSNVEIEANLVLNAGIYVYVTGGMTLNGTATLGASAGIYFTGTQSLLGNGSVVLSSGNYLYPYPGPLTIGPDMTIRGQSGTVGHPSYELVNQGTLRAETSGQTIYVYGANWTNDIAGRLEADGGGLLYLNGPWTNNGALSIAHQSSASSLNGYTQSSTGRLSVELGGTDSSLYGSLAVTGAASVAGQLEVLTANFTPAIGDEFEILTSSGVTGSFSVPPPDYLTIYDQQGGTITLQSQVGASQTLLDWSDSLGFDDTDGVNPDKGLPGQAFEFRVDYTDTGGLLPGTGFPKLRLDLDGNGAPEHEYVMLAVDGDSNVTNGKTYFYPISLADPAPGAYRYSFRAENSAAQVATGAPTNWKDGPDVRDDLYNLEIFANDISFSHPAPAVGQSFIVTVRFDNDSLLPVDDVLVSVESEGDVIFTGTVAHLDAGSTGQLSFPWAFTQDGFYPLRAYVDSDYQYEEWNELDNNATRPIVVGDYTVPGSIDIQGLPTQVTYNPGGYVSFSGLARYLGTPVVPAPVLQGGTLTFRPGWTSDQVTNTNDNGQFGLWFLAPTSGTWLLEVEVTDYTITSTYEIELVPPPEPPQGPNLRMNLVADKTAACVGEMVTLSWSVTNVGNQPSPATVAELGAPGETPLAEGVVIPILVQGATEVLTSHVVVAAAPGSRTYTARVDPANTVEELSENDNAYSVGFQAYPNCLEWDPDYVRFWPPPPYCTGHPISMGFYVQNTGCFPAPATVVRFRINGNVIEDLPFDALAGKGGVASFGLTHTFAAAGTYLVSFELDPLGELNPLGEYDECDDGNNLISAEITVVSCETLDYQVDACSIEASDDDPLVGQSIAFRATVRNTGTLDGANPLVVRFLLDGVPFGSDVTTSAPLLAGGSELVVSAMTWPMDLDPHQLQVVLDPNDAEAESAEYNNQATRVLPYELHPVPIPSCPGYGQVPMFSTCSPCVNAPMTIRGVVINTGLFRVSQADVEFVDAYGGMTLLGTLPVTNALEARGECLPSTGEALLPVMFAGVGLHPITVRVDPADTWPEYDESDNTLTRTLIVSSCIPLPDLTIRSEHINPEDINPDPGQEIDSVIVTALNLGPIEAADVLADVNIDGQTWFAGLPLGTIPADSSRSVECVLPVPWEAPAGPPNLHIVQVVIDPLDAIPEYVETNNSATRSLVVGPAPDLSISRADMNLTSGGAPGSLTAWIRVLNAGSVAGSGQLAVSLVNDNGQANLLDEVPVMLPAAAGSRAAELWVPVTWQSNARAAHVRATLTDVSPQDYDEINNLAERNLEREPKARRR